jgi:hypothetical protein
MIAHPFAQPDVHALFVAFSDDDQIDGKLAVHGLDRAKRVQLRHLRPFGVRGATADQHFRIRRLLDEPRFERRMLPRVGLRDRHRVVHPVDEERLLCTLVALGIHDGIARRAVLGDANIEHLRLLASELVEEAFDHFGRLGDALTGV